jgi:hypothetical protein
MLNNVFVKIVPFMGMWKNMGARQATGDRIIQCMCLACGITKAAGMR